jgi:hypothetical protein
MVDIVVAENGISRKPFLKLLGVQKRVDQVGHGEKRDDQAEKVFQFHMPPLKTIAPDNVAPRDCKEDYGDHDED